MEVHFMLVKYEIKEGSENLTSHSGLALMGALLNQTELNPILSTLQLSGCLEPEISHKDIIYSMTGLLCLGKTNYEDIEQFRDQPFFSHSLGLDHCPASSTLRQRLDIFESNVGAIIKIESVKLVGKLCRELTPISTLTGELIPLDIDVSPFDNSKSHKELVSRTYKNTDGYSPIFGYLGIEGYLVNCELRAGSQHCQKGTPEFLRAAIENSQQITDNRLLVRMDSGNDSIDNIKECIDLGSDWLIKRNLRKESLSFRLEIAKSFGSEICSRRGKRVWLGSIERQVKDIADPLRIVFKVIERTVDKKGNLLLIPEIEVDSYWTSLEDSAGYVIELYHQHGTSEQYHSELKTDLDLERLPSGFFQTNTLILELGMLAYNMLRLCGQESLVAHNDNLSNRAYYRRKAKRRRLRTVLQDLIYIAGRITYHGRRWYLSFGRYCYWYKVWQNLYVRFQTPM